MSDTEQRAVDDTERRTVDELITRYTYHPELRDLFVEGDRDVRMFRWFLSLLPKNRAAIYQVNTIDLPPQAVIDTGGTEEGNRGRAIALGLLLEKTLAEECEAVLCCVDKDFHDFGFALPSCRYLVYTDVACIECYAFQANPLAKLFQIYLNKSLSHREIDAMKKVLSYVFIVRLIKRKLAPTAHWFEDFTSLDFSNAARNRSPNEVLAA
jgi:hypothetical protein